MGEVFDLVVHPDGTASCVYNDRLAALVMGRDSEVKRASNVEFNEKKKVWEAKLCGTKRIIASGKNRAKVIAKEVEYLKNLTFTKVKSTKKLPFKK